MVQVPIEVVSRNLPMWTRWRCGDGGAVVIGYWSKLLCLDYLKIYSSSQSPICSFMLYAKAIKQEPHGKYTWFGWVPDSLPLPVTFEDVKLMTLGWPIKNSIDLVQKLGDALETLQLRYLRDQFDMLKVTLLGCPTKDDPWPTIPKRRAKPSSPKPYSCSTN